MPASTRPAPSATACAAPRPTPSPSCATATATGTATTPTKRSPISTPPIGAACCAPPAAPRRSRCSTTCPTAAYASASSSPTARRSPVASSTRPPAPWCGASSCASWSRSPIPTPPTAARCAPSSRQPWRCAMAEVMHAAEPSGRAGARPARPKPRPTAREDGHALLTALVATALLLPLGAFAVLQARLDFLVQHYTRAASEAFAVAESGLEHARADLARDPRFERLLAGPDRRAGTADDGEYPFAQPP